MSDYLQFLRSKIVTAPSSGFRVDPSEINPALKPHQRDGVVWALVGGLTVAIGFVVVWFGEECERATRRERMERGR